MPVTHRLSTACLPLAPVFLFGYCAVRLLDPTRSAGAVWAVGHVFYLASYPAVGGAAWALRRLLAADAGTSVRRLGSGLVVLSWLGAFCGIGQSVIDIVAGALAINMAKVFGTETANRIVTTAMRLTGGQAFFADSALPCSSPGAEAIE